MSQHVDPLTGEVFDTYGDVDADTLYVVRTDAPLLNWEHDERFGQVTP